MAKEVTTLFIRDTAVSLLVVRGKRVKKWASLPLEPGLFSQGLVLDEAQVAAKLKELFKLEKVKTKKVIVGLSGHNSLYRLITLPELPELVVAEAVKHEARRVIPVPLDEVYLSYQLLPAPAGEKPIFLAAFPRNVADTLIRTLHRAGIKLYIMDLAPLALCRTVDEPRAIIVNVRLDHLSIIVMADRLPQLIRRLSLPGEAESLSEKLPAITEEFSRTVAFYNSSNPEKPLDSTVPVFVGGELAEAPETWQSVVGKLGYSVSPLPSPVEAPEGFNPNEFMVNIGLALKELSPEKWGMNFSLVNFNALPEVYLPKGIALPNILLPVSVIVGIGLVIFMVFLVQNSMAHTEVLRSQLALTESRIVQQHKEIATLKEQIEPMEGQIKQVEAEIEPVEATTNIFKTTFTSLGKGSKKVDGDLSQIVSLLPTEVNLTEVNHGGSSVTVNGIAQDEDDIFKYARDLRSRGGFSTVIIISIEAYYEEDEGGEIERGFNFEFLLK